MPLSFRSRYAFALVLAALLWFPKSASAACAVSPSITSALGTYSPAAVDLRAVPALRSRAGLECPVAALTLISNNRIVAKFTSTNNFLLLREGGGSIPYTASAAANGSGPFTQGATVDYMQNNLLNLLGLLGGSSADLPFFIKPVATGAPPLGAYVDTITIDWDWNLCPGIGALGLCVGTRDRGTGRSIMTVTLTVSPRDVTITMTTQTTWSPVNGTSNPKAVPGSRQRVAVNVANPDIVPLDAGTLAIVLPTPAGLSVALDGDGATPGPAIRLIDGTAASGLTLRYGGGSDATDDVDFSSDSGATWLYAPQAATQRAITHVRLRPQKAMAPQSAFSLTVPYLVH
jgi:hypothetical protein